MTINASLPAGERAKEGILKIDFISDVNGERELFWAQVKPSAKAENYLSFEAGLYQYYDRLRSAAPKNTHTDLIFDRSKPFSFVFEYSKDHTLFVTFTGTDTVFNFNQTSAHQLTDTRLFELKGIAEVYGYRYEKI